MVARSAGILLFRRAAGGVEVLIAHMGGPFWARKDAGAWSIPKGEHEPEEDAYDAARREFAEELGAAPPAGEALDLGEIRQRNGKVVHAWAIEGDFDETTAVSNVITIEWPRGSGRTQQIPEVDRVAWFSVDAAREKLIKGQASFLDRLVDLAGRAGDAG